MSEEPEPGPPSNEPPRMALYAIYAVLAMVLIAVFIIVGVYGT